MAYKKKENGPYNGAGFELIIMRGSHSALCSSIRDYQRKIREADPVLEDILIKSLRIRLEVDSRCEVEVRRGIEQLEALKAESAPA